MHVPVKSGNTQSPERGTAPFEAAPLYFNTSRGRDLVPDVPDDCPCLGRDIPSELAMENFSLSSLDIVGGGEERYVKAPHPPNQKALKIKQITKTRLIHSASVSVRLQIAILW